MDRGFFIAEIEACTDMMYRVAWSILRNDDDVQDALQDAALKAWEKRNKLKEEKYFRTWIVRILINVCYDAQRKHRRNVPLEEIPEGTYASVPDPDLAIALAAVPEKLLLLSSHLVEEMEAVADRAVFIKKGRLVEVRDLEEMRESDGVSMADRYRAIFGHGEVQA